MNFLSLRRVRWNQSDGACVMEDQLYVNVNVLHCRRCESEELLELARLAGGDHTVYRCRDCGFLFSPPDETAAAARGPGIEPSPLRRRPAFGG